MRYVILAAAVLMQVCLGGLYAWSSFVPALQKTHGLSTAQTQVVFGGLIATFTLAMVFAGRVLDRFGPRLISAAGAVLFGSGYFVASRSGGSFAGLLAGISLVAGIGTGFCYVCPLAAGVRWFPAHKGLVTGVSVAGFGGGAALLSILAEGFLARGMDVLAFFGWIGVAYGMTILAAALTLRFPETGRRTETSRPPGARLLMRDPGFWGLAAGMFSGTFAGLLIIGNLKPLALSRGMALAPAVMAISVLSLGNALGRVTWGWIYDRIGTGTVPVSLGFLAAALGMLLTVSAHPAAFVAVSALIGFGFGACFVVYVAQAASRYGAEHVGSVYPLVFLAYGASGVTGPWVGGRLYDASGSYLLSVAVSILVVSVGAAASWRLLRRGTIRSRAA